MNRYPAPSIPDLPDDIRAKVLEVQEKAGFVPNVFLALARRDVSVQRAGGAAGKANGGPDTYPGSCLPKSPSR